MIRGEYLGWYSENLTLIRCKIIGTQPLCYCRNLTLIDCEPAAGAEPVALEHSELGWFTPEEMGTLDFCPADAELLPVVFGKV